MENNFLQVNKKWLSNRELTLLDKLIVAQIQEYTRNKKECYMTDKQFADAFGVNVQQVTRAMKKLADNGIIVRNTQTVSNNGQSSKIRTLKAIVKNDYSLTEGIVKNDKRNSQNDTKGIITSDNIKDNLKENIKDNLESANAERAEKRELEDLEDLEERELESIKRDYKNHMSYNDIKNKYNLTRINQQMCENIEVLLKAKVAERQEAEQRKDAELAPVYNQLATYLGEQKNAVKGFIKSLNIDAITLLDFANANPQYSFTYYDDDENNCKEGYHRVNNVGETVANVSYKQYLLKGINAFCA